MVVFIPDGIVIDDVGRIRKVIGVCYCRRGCQFIDDDDEVADFIVCALMSELFPMMMLL